MKILIAVPCFGPIEPDVFKSIYGIQRPDGAALQFDFVRGYNCATARNMIADEAIEYGFDYVLMVDSDMIIPSNALKCMLEHNAPLVLGCYPRKNTTNETFELTKTGYKDYTENWTYSEICQQVGAFEIKGGGFGCALIDVAVMKTLPRPLFKYVEYDNGNLLSEDNYFCGQVHDAGYPVYADARVMCGHAIRGYQWR